MAFRCRLSAFRCYCLLDSIPESKRVQVPFGTPVLSFVRFAPNDGFGPESASPPSLVQRGVLYAAAGCGIALMGDEYMPPQAAIKWRRQAPTSLAAAILHNYPGRSPQPVREAQPVPDRTLAAQGRQARWLPQPSRPKGREGLREYSLVSYLHGAACGEAAIEPSRLRVSI